jgi:hypothetical protein
VRDVLHVEVVRRPNRAARHLVVGQQHRRLVQHQVGDAGLLDRLPPRGRGQGRVAGFAVTAQLQPPPYLAVQRQQHPRPVGAQHQRAGGDVVGPAAAPDAVGVPPQVPQVGLA